MGQSFALTDYKIVSGELRGWGGLYNCTYFVLEND